MQAEVLQKLAQQAEEFWRLGYLVLPNVVTQEEIDGINAVIQLSQSERPHLWANLSESFRQSVNILKDYPEFDPFIENPRTLPVLRQILGEDISFEELYEVVSQPFNDGVQAG